uniref:L1 transposable element RRM domain-containing protein n=1 Tax=Molossus molossus TaxID=27622 RepID=A0A7J8CRT4_MOLMO|nr:hypothetical protein HJG59_009775 [Molossus molossus]
MTENFHNLVKKKVTQVQEAQRVLIKMNPKTSTQKHIIIKMTNVKDQERILKAARERQKVTYKGVPIKLTAYFSTETLQARRDWQEVLKVMKSKGFNPRLFYPARLSFKIEDSPGWFGSAVRASACGPERPGSVPAKGTYFGCSLSPALVGRAVAATQCVPFTSMFLSLCLFLSLPPTLSVQKMEQCPRVRIKK